MMNKRTISNFYNEDAIAYSSYDNIRKLCGFDGLKLSQRKLIWSGFKRCLNEYLKTETFANQCAIDTAYIHGATNLVGVIDTMTSNYIGANNYPLFDGNSGGFGCRITPRCSAGRYTRNKISNISKLIFKSIDNEILDKQFFEAQYIEPKYLIPVFPALFLNGSDGLSTGFSQKIYPRNPFEVIEYIKKKISGTVKPRMNLNPWFKGFKGEIRVNQETGINECVGVIEQKNTTTYYITEIPVETTYQKYVEFLDKLSDDGVIQDYIDKCDPKTDEILFEIKTTREFTKKHDNIESLNKVFKLVKSLPETFNVIDENNRVKEYTNATDILDDFITIRLGYYEKRKKYLLETIKRDLTKLVSQFLFVKNIVDEKIIVNKKSKEDIIKQIEPIEKIIKIDDSYDYLLKLPLYSLTKERLEELKNQIEKGKEEFKLIKETSIETMWSNDLHDIKKVL